MGQAYDTSVISTSIAQVAHEMSVFYEGHISSLYFNLLFFSSLSCFQLLRCINSLYAGAYFGLRDTVYLPCLLEISSRASEINKSNIYFLSAMSHIRAIVE